MPRETVGATLTSAAEPAALTAIFVKKSIQPWKVVLVAFVEKQHAAC